jgi:hypothetical protein
VSRRVVLASVLTVSLLGAIARDAEGAPLAVLAPESTGQRRPSRAERLALADAVATTLSRELPEVLSGSETRSRLSVLDPARLSCDAAACGGPVAALLGARGVVLVRVRTAGASLQLEIEAVGATGETLASEQGDATIADWQDALALGRVVAARLGTRLAQRERASVAAETPVTAPTEADGAPSPVASGPAPEARASGIRVGQTVAGGALVAAGGVTAALAIVALAAGRQCVDSNPAVCEPGTEPVSPPGAFTEPSPWNYAWLAAGGVALTAGVVLMVGGLTARAPASPTRPIVGVLPSREGAVFSLSMGF